VNDHADRVVPAFARAAVNGEALRVDGRDHTFDFTHLEDTVIGLIKMIELLRKENTAPPPLHLLTGCQTSLHELARLAIEAAGGSSSIREAPPRSYDVSHFFGDPDRAKEVLGWESMISIREGMSRLVKDFQDQEDKAELEQAS
jgi:nucleoside-diphosphate-sugar epimerase